MDISGYPYMLRVDMIPHPQDAEVDYIMCSELEVKYLTIFKTFQDWSDTSIHDYILGFEISENGKPHLQAILWFHTILPQTKLSKYRNWWKKYATDTYQPVAFTKSIKPDSLAIYCMKDNQFTSSLPPETISKFPEWRDNLKKPDKISKKDLFLKMCMDYINNNKQEFQQTHSQLIASNPHYEFEKKTGSSNQTYKHYLNPGYYLQYLERFSMIYYEIYKTPMRRHSGINALFYTKILNHADYISNLYSNFFSNSIL